MAAEDDPPVRGSEQIILNYLQDLLGSPPPAPAKASPVVATDSTAEPASPPPTSASRNATAGTSSAKSVPAAGIAAGSPASAQPPDWALQAFQCLLFKVAGLSLAVPLMKLGGVHAVDADLTPLFGLPDWFLGLSRQGESLLKVVDTACWIMPERYSRDWLKTVKFVIRLGASEWAIACSEISEALTLQPQQVKWRTGQAKRPWLAGTVISQMCVLIDVDGLMAMLE